MRVEKKPLDAAPDNVVSFLPNGRRSGGGGGPKNEHGLTVRQEAFVRQVLDGLNYSDAYRQSYNAEAMKPSTVWREAYEIANRPQVKARLDALVKARDDRALFDSARARAFIREQLWTESCNLQNRASDRLRALELLGKLSEVGAFAKRTEVVGNDLSAEAIERRIAELLNSAER